MPDDPTTVRKPNYKELGISGTRLFAGLIQEETVPQLQGDNAYKTFTGMRFDATGAGLLQAITLPIRSARWYVDPASDQKKDVDVADFVHSVLFDFGSQSFDDVVRLAVEGSLAYGFNLMEIIWANIDFGEFQGKVGWDSLAWRSQNTKWRWEMDTVNGRRQLVGFTQLAPPWYQQQFIPRNKFLLWVNQLEGDRYDGISVFRSAFKDYFIRDRLYRIRSIGLERSYMSTPIAKLPEGYADSLADLAKQVVQTIRADEQAGVVLPPDLELELASWNINAQAMDGAINFHNRQMLVSALAQFVDLGSGSAGSFALSADQSELFLDAVNGHANYFAETLNLEPGIPSLVDINYAGMDHSKLARLTHGDIGRRAADTWGAMAQLAAWGFLTPDDATEDRLRQIFDLPEREETISPDALKDLSDQIFPEETEYGYTAHGKRLPSPLATQAAGVAAKAQGAAPGGGASSIPAPPGGAGPPGAPPAHQPPPNGSGRSAANPRQQQMMAEYAVRIPWDRPRGRPTEEQRRAMQATTKFTERMEDLYGDVKHRRGQKPDKPSVRLAKSRRPYQVSRQFAEEARGQQVPPGYHQRVVSRQQAIARKFRPQLVEALRPKVTR